MSLDEKVIEQYTSDIMEKAEKSSWGDAANLYFIHMHYLRSRERLEKEHCNDDRQFCYICVFRVSDVVCTLLMLME